MNSTPAFRDYPPDDPITELDGSRLPALERLHKPARIRQVLVLIVDASVVKKQGATLVGAFDALDAVTNPDEELRWWRRYGPLFQVSGAPAPP